MAIRLSVPGMSCGHCVRTITEAVRQVDAEATVTADLEQRSVTIDSASADAQRMVAAMQQAGYPSQPAA